MVLNMIITKRKKFLISWDVDYLIQYILSVFETFSFFENVIMEPHCVMVPVYKDKRRYKITTFYDVIKGRYQ